MFFLGNLTFAWPYWVVFWGIFVASFPFQQKVQRILEMFFTHIKEITIVILSNLYSDKL